MGHSNRERVGTMKEVVLRFKKRIDPWEPQIVQVYNRKDGTIQFEDTVYGTYDWLDIFGFRPDLLNKVWRVE